MELWGCLRGNFFLIYSKFIQKQIIHLLRFMINTIIRINSWFSTFFYTLMSFLCLLMIFAEDFDGYKLVTCLLFLTLAITGFVTRNFGLTTFKFFKYLKHLAILCLVFAILFVIVAPLLLINHFGIDDSFGAILILIVMFIPAIVSSLAILFYKPKENIKII